MGVLEEKVAVVTGGASGIGLASARMLTAEGAKVVVVDVDEPGARLVAAELGGEAVRADVSVPGDWQAVVSAARRLGGLDVVHLNAGVTTGRQDLSELEDDEYRRIMGVNVDGVVFGVRAVLPELVARGGGAIAVTASLAGLLAFPIDPLYTMTKHAVVGLVRALARDLEERKVTINAICPGLVDTPLIDGEVRDALADSGFPLIAPSSVAEAVMAALTGTDTGQAIMVQAGREPTPYRFGGVIGPREPGAEGRIPPTWLADTAERARAPREPRPPSA
jgi:NAD(P)-dependent dehydrogenase (short-subunit alcohol dehydrogenase family)